MSTRKSMQLYRRAAEKIPGGVNSPVRAWKAVGGTPKFVRNGRGSHITDADQKQYIDFVGSWGPLILGHANGNILRCLRQVAKRGTTFGAPTEGEVKLAETVCRFVPSIQKMRLVSSGTEATMSAIRLARAYTSRTKIVKFDGCYHGHADGLLVKPDQGSRRWACPIARGFRQDSRGKPSSQHSTMSAR